MDLKELLQKREEAIELRKKKEILEIEIESYKNTVFKLKTPSQEALFKFLQKIGIKDFNVNEEVLAEKFLEKLALKTSAVPVHEFIFDCFVEPDLNNLAGELMAELNVKSRTEILRSFFSENEVFQILLAIITRIAENNKEQNEQVVNLKKK